MDTRTWGHLCYTVRPWDDKRCLDDKQSLTVAQEDMTLSLFLFPTDAELVAALQACKASHLECKQEKM